MTNALPSAILRRTGLTVTRLGYGAMELRGTRIWNGRPVTDGQAGTILNAVLDAGINLIDTANDYGLSEELIGKHISHRRSDYYLATKCGCHVTRRDENTDDTPHIWTRENLMRNLHESLQRLKTDYLDVMQLHNPSVEQCEEGDLVRVLQDMREQGKVRWIGVSTTLPDLPTYLGWGVFDTFQIPYSALERRHERWISRVAEAGASAIIRGAAARGEPGEGRGGAERWETFAQANLDDLLEHAESRTAFVLRFTLTHPHIHTIIVGTLRPEHLAENIEAVARGPLPPDVYAEAKRRLDAAGVAPDQA